MKSQRAVIGFLIVMVFFSGCLMPWNIRTDGKEYPRYDQVLVFDRPFDVTYLRTLEALNTVPGWVLDETDKEKGLIVLRNRQYGHIWDKDKRVARFILKYVNRKQTSVELDGPSQRLEEGGLLLDRINQMMIATSPRKEVSS